MCIAYPRSPVVSRGWEVPLGDYYLRVLILVQISDLEKFPKFLTRKNFYSCVNKLCTTSSIQCTLIFTC